MKIKLTVVLLCLLGVFLLWSLHNSRPARAEAQINPEPCRCSFPQEIEPPAAGNRILLYHCQCGELDCVLTRDPDELRCVKMDR